MKPSSAPEGLRERRHTFSLSPDDLSKPLPPSKDPSFEEKSLSPIARLWQASSKDISFQGDGGSGGQARSWSFGNILSAIQLIQLLFWGVVDLFLRDTLRDAGIFLARKAMQGVMPAAKWVILMFWVKTLTEGSGRRKRCSTLSRRVSRNPSSCPMSSGSRFAQLRLIALKGWRAS